ncbi:ABC transporter ATP-binding protein [Actinorhabdospora filicis]|uniref:ABC transporter ATP-binding protein n=1 Tax=Actinorhabdospora filicis TaxID=1785913 RepID=A0A9W6SHZ0_9ACTN|nr:ABC transporter ATP-binding protein [Actinorhabdospora filicis]GLZ76333.1 ABC transporter ATP-binding protein [Actinorhabdospora filicis]
MTVQTPPKPEVKESHAWRGIADTEEAERTSAEQDDASSIKALRARGRKLLGSLIRPYRKVLLWTVVLLLIQNAAGMAGPLLVKLGIDAGIPPIVENENYATLIAVGAAFLAAIAVEYLTKRGFLSLSGKVGQQILLDLRRRVFTHFQKLSIAFHERFTSGRVVARLTSDMDAIRELADGGVNDLVLSALSIVTISVILLVLDPMLALVALLSFPVMLWLSNWFRVNSARVYRRTRETIALVIVYFVESMGGVRAVQAYRREPRNQRIFDDLNEDNRAENVAGHRLSATFAGGVKGIGNLTTALVLAYGAYRVLHHQTDVGVLAAFVLYLRRFFDPMQELSMFYNTLQSANAALDKLAGVLAEEPDVPEPAEPKPLPAARGELRFDRVRFWYHKDKVVLPTFDLHIPAGQTVALVGATGAGKTTIAKLVSRFYDPSEGVVSLDGVSLKDIAEPELRRAVAMVTQENFLFAGTIGENIAFGRPDATREQIEEAARAIGAHEFITGLPEGYDTDVRKRGGRLSAGQRQLVAFARAFLADPRVLILDEATSSLDIPSERLVQRALRTILADRTAIVIAHRLSTVEIADRVLVLDGGQVVEDGPPSALIDGGGRYAKLHEQWQDSLV